MATATRWRRWSLLAGWVATLPGACATPTTSSEALTPGTLNRAALRASQPRSIALAERTSVAFDIQPPPGALFFGVVGATFASAAVHTDEATTNAYNMEDPAAAIRAAIVARLARRFGMTVVPEADAHPDEGSGAPIATDLTLAIDTTVWGVMPTGLNGRWGVKYRGTLRLTDNRTHQVLAEGTCTSIPVDGEDLPTFNQLQAHKGTLLRASLAAVADFCTDDYRKRVLGLY